MSSVVVITDCGTACSPQRCYRWLRRATRLACRTRTIFIQVEIDGFDNSVDYRNHHAMLTGDLTPDSPPPPSRAGHGLAEAIQVFGHVCYG